jgi:16S rRNA C967 or C1407 C5-methylase (RsmB/RsmF family)
MKRFLTLMSFALFTVNVYAQILTPSQSAAVSNYYRTHERYIDAYKAMNSLSMFSFGADLKCNKDQLPDWRIKQYDETFKKCENKIYKGMMKHFTASYKPKATELYSQNIELEEELKRKGLEAVGFKLTKDQYGYRSLNLEDETVTAERIEDAANLLERILDEQ